jgi:predicted Zn-dependent protease
MTRLHRQLIVGLLLLIGMAAPLLAQNAAPKQGGLRAEDIHLSAGRAAAENRDFERAIRHFREALRRIPKDPAARKEFADLLFRAGYADEALETYDGLLKEQPHRVDIRYAAVDAVMASDDWEGVLKRLDAFPANARTERRYRLRRARAYGRTKQWSRAIPIYKALVDEAPEKRESHKEYLGVLLAAYRWDDLQSQTRRYLKLWPKDPDVRLYSADLLLNQDRVEEATALLEKLSRDPKTASDPILARLADLRLACGVPGERVRSELEHATRGRKAPLIRARLAVMYAYDAQFHQAFKSLHQAIRQGADPTETLATRAEIHTIGGMYRTSLKQFELLIKIDRASSRALKDTARAAAPIHRGEEARTALRRAVITYPGDMDATYQYIALLEKRGELKEALAIVDTIADSQPKNATTRLLRGRLLVADGRKGEAKADYEFVTQLLLTHGVTGAMRKGRIFKNNMALVPSAVWITVCKRSPNDHAALAQLAKAFYREAQLGNSYDAWEKAVKAAPTKDAYRIGLVEALVARGLLAVKGSRQRLAEEMPRLVASTRLARADQARLAELLVKLEHWEDARIVTGRMLEDAPDDVHALSLHVGALLFLEREAEARKLLDEFLIRKPITPVAEFRLWTRLGALAITREDAAYPISMTGLKALLARNPKNLDIRQAIGWLATINKDYDEGRKALDSVLAELPEDANALLWRARLESWDTEYSTAIEYYDRYAKVNPGDRRLVLERARVLSWDLRYEDAWAEYTRGIREDGATDPPRDTDSAWAWTLYLEREAKKYKWNKREWHAIDTYDRLIAIQPEEPEILFDRGQMDTTLNFSRRAADYYERTILLAPGHSQARAALDYERHRLNASIRETFSYRDEKGFNNRFQIEEFLLTTTLWSPELGDILCDDMWWAGFEYEHGWYRFKNFPSVDAERYKFMLRKRFYSGLQLDAWFKRSWYSRVAHHTTNYALEANYKAFDFLRTHASFTREDILENFNTIAQETYRYNYKVGLGADLTRRLSVDAWGAWVHVSDGNDGRRARANAEYELLLYPTLLKLAYSVEYWDYDRTNQVYFSPNDFFQHGPALHWRHYLQDEHYVGTNELYYGIKLPLMIDNHGDAYFNLGLEFLWDITNQWQLGADATFIRSNPYDGTFCTAWLRYRF